MFIFRKEFLKDYTFADAHLLARVTSYYGEVITNMVFALVLRFLENTCKTSIFRKEFLKDYTSVDAHLLT